MKRHFVHFLSPGSFVSEITIKPIDTWDVDRAIALSHTVSERYGATPYGFFFTTRQREDQDLDSKEVDKSHRYFLGGTVLSLQDIRDREDPRDSILISNMEENHWEKVLENNNSWMSRHPLKPGDVVLDLTPEDFIDRESKT